MFKKSKWEIWYDEQPEYIKRWIDQPRPLWYDSDMWKAGLTGFIFGVLIGLAL